MPEQKNRPSGSASAAPLPESVAPLADVRTFDEEERKNLEQMARTAREYICSFSWCTEVAQQYFAGGVGCVFAIYLFDITPSRADIPSRVWVFVGDVPMAYLDIQDAATPLAAFDLYVEGMRRWVKAARSGASLENRPDLPPVNVPATPEWADQLAGRLDFLVANVRDIFVSDTRM
jgi:hypothetical protein